MSISLRSAIGIFRRITGRQRTIVVNADRHGYGDAMTTAWIAEGSRHDSVRLTHWATGEKRRLLELFGQTIAESDDGAIATFDAYKVETEIERGSVPRVHSRGLQIGIDGEPDRPKLQRLSPEAVAWAEDLWNHASEGGKKPVVMMCPQTCYKSREWPASYWVDLGWGLAAAGFGVTFQLGGDDSRFHSTPRYHFGHSWEYKIAMMRRCNVVVGVDSAPVHVAGTINVPTIALMGPTKSTVFSHLSSVECLHAPADRLDCVGCHFGHPYRAACDQGCMSLMQLRVSDVAKVVARKAGK